MAHYVADAIELISDDGTGLPVAYTNTGIGLASNGHFYLITGRLGLDGSKTIAGDTARTVWYEQILANDPGGMLPSWSADFIERGCVASVSSMYFAIKNTAAFWNTLKTNGVNLGRRTVILYKVTSSDGVTFTFRQRWRGIVDDQPFSELTFRVNCVDDQKSIFSSLPPLSLDSRFVDAPNKDKAIPIALGRVAHSPLVNANSAGAKTNLCFISGVAYNVAAATSISSTVVYLYTKGERFTVTSQKLKGKFLLMVAGGAEQAILITGNDATIPTTEETRVYIAEAFTGSPVVWPSGTSASVWYFQVVDFAPILMASDKPVYSLRKNLQGRRTLSIYATDQKNYSDISDFILAASASNIKYTGHPGFSAMAKSADVSGNIIGHSSIVPSAITVVSATGWTASDLSAGDPANKLCDQNEDNSHSYAFVKVGTAVGQTASIVLDVAIPKDDVLKVFDALYILPDLQQKYSSGSYNARVDVTAQHLDFYGRAVSSPVSAETIYDDPLGSSYSPLYLLPGSYFEDVRDDSNFYAYKSALDIVSVVGDTKKAATYNKVRFRIDFYWSANSGTTYSLLFNELGIVGKRSVGTTTETLYAGMYGETFGTPWTARKTATAPVLTMTDALEHLIRRYDVKAPVWSGTASSAVKTYAAGDLVRSTADNGHVYICTVAGAPGSSEPTFPTTAGATVTDGAVTWKELYTIPINLATFNTMATQRAGWFIGRTLTEKKASFDYYKQMAEHGFFILLIDAFGQVKVKAWRENTTALLTLDSSNILEGTVGEMGTSPMARVCNDILIQYDENLGAGNFNARIGITNTDKPAFPTEADVLSPGSGLGTFSIGLVPLGSGKYFFRVLTDTPHGLVTGDFASLSGNNIGNDFPPSVVSVEDAGTFYVTGFLAGPADSTSGTLMRNATATLKWRTYAFGFQLYAAGKSAWDKGRASYLLTKAVQKLAEDAGKSPWFIDPIAKDASKNLIWADTDDPTLDITNIADDHPAAYRVKQEAEWGAWQKKLPTFEVEEETAVVTVASEGVTRELEIGDAVNFNDAKNTAGVSLLGWISEKAYLAETDKLPRRIRFGLILNPEGLTTCNRILDVPGSANRILDVPSSTNRVLDAPC